jgi:hypothetical protein
MQETFVFIVGAVFAIMLIVLVSLIVSNSNYQEDAKKLIPKDWNPEHVFHSFPILVINSETQQIAFIDRKEATIVNFSDIKSWRHHWTDKMRARPGLVVGTKVSHSTTNHYVKIVAAGLKSPSIIVSSVTVRPDRYPFQRQGSRSSTFVIL